MAELKVPGIVLLRLARDAFNGCDETFNYRFSAEGLLAIYRAWTASAWSISPDRWTMLQVNAALDGYVPQWSPDERPIELLEHGPWQDELMYEMQAEEWQEAHSHND